MKHMDNSKNNLTRVLVKKSISKARDVHSIKDMVKFPLRRRLRRIQFL
jgi:hypothetical protein